MEAGADVRAVAVLQEWHGQFSRFRQEALEALSMIRMEIRKAYDWIEHTAREWKFEIRDAEEEVVQRKVELAQREMPNFDGRIPDTTVQEQNLARAKARLAHAHQQVDICRKWAGKLPKMIAEEYEVASRQLSNMLETEVLNALAHLLEQVAALERYLDLRPSAPGG
ncbi:hypothetical protein [Zavarzinella formosa]|uniref:hypothetical protein n=1 Tax=Zavarzinella formosa TaxID=360055 RepID=UPI00031B58DB|nr:hypothetical protein [Zavarzinella formosa]